MKKRKSNYLVVFIVIMVECLFLSGCGDENAQENKIDVFSHRNVTYIPETTYGDWIDTVEDSNGVSYALYENGTAEVINARRLESNVVVIPEKIEGCRVTGIRESAFEATGVEEVHIPDTVKYIGEAAFCYCDNLKVVEFGKGLLEIGEAAFLDTSISEIVLPEKLEIIQFGAFCNTPLEHINIPDSVRMIGGEAFFNCLQLTDIEIGAGVERIDMSAFTLTPWDVEHQEEFVIVGDGVLLEYNGSAAYVEIPEGVKSLADAFMNHSEIVRVQLPNTLVAIGDDTFYECYNLETVVIPENVKYIGSTPFKSVGAKIFLPKSLKYIDDDIFYEVSFEETLYEGSEEEWNALIADTPLRHEVAVRYNVSRDEIEN